MKKQGPGEQGTKGPERTAGLLRRALPPVEERSEFSRDLWPEMLRRLRAETAPEPAKVRVPWFDWALAAGLVALLALFPAWIPVLLYYL
jgi:hypothetical protein